uniref:Uncharacterized protein n=1 Tax=Rhizophagus irregularis (strain DAOM 181602 / DAOM 197198 / MUCL 43194) TaxID=747089 RepID=U9UIN9_RHIID
MELNIKVYTKPLQFSDVSMMHRPSRNHSEKETLLHLGPGPLMATLTQRLS